MNELRHFNPYHNPKNGQFTSKGSVFISGSSKTQSKESEYYRRTLPKNVRKMIDRYIQDGKHINVGDAPGVDRQVQNYLKKKGYRDVTVYGPGKEVRYLANKKWKTKPVDDPDHEPGSKEWLAKKDVAMTDDSTEGLAVILDEGAKATRKNVQRLIDQNKDVFVYELSIRGRKYDRDAIDFVDSLKNRKI